MSTAKLSENQKKVLSWLKSRGGAHYCYEIGVGVGLPAIAVGSVVRALEKRQLVARHYRHGCGVYSCWRAL